MLDRKKQEDEEYRQLEREVGLITIIGEAAEQAQSLATDMSLDQEERIWQGCKAQCLTLLGVMVVFPTLGGMAGNALIRVARYKLAHFHTNRESEEKLKRVSLSPLLEEDDSRSDLTFSELLGTRDKDETSNFH